jgi:zinc transporter 1
LIIVAGVGLLFNVIGLFVFSGHGGHSHSHGHGGHSHGHSKEKHSHNKKKKEHSHSHGHSDKKKKKKEGHSHSHKHDHHDHEHEHNEKHNHEHEHKAPKSPNAKRHANAEHMSEKEDNQSNEIPIELTTIAAVEVDPAIIDIEANSHSDHHSHDEHEEEEEEKERSVTLYSVWLHVLGDALGSLAVIGSGLFIWLTHFSWRYYIDPVISIIISLILIRSAIRLIKTTSLVILQSVPHNVDVKKLREEIAKLEGVLGIHELHVWQLDEKRNICTVHIASRAEDDYMEIGQQVKDIMHQHGIHNTTVQQEFIYTHETMETMYLQNSNSNSAIGESEICALVCKESSCRKRVCCAHD